MLVFTSISSFPGCKFVLRKISIRIKASERVSSFKFRGALDVGCFVGVTAVEGKAEKAVDFTCTKSAVCGLGAIRLNLEMRQLSPPFGGDNAIVFFFARAR